MDCLLEEGRDCKLIGLESEAFSVISPGGLDEFVDGFSFLAVAGGDLLHLEAPDVDELAKPEAVRFDFQQHDVLFYSQQVVARLVELKHRLVYILQDLLIERVLGTLYLVPLRLVRDHYPVER